MNFTDNDCYGLVLLQDAMAIMRDAHSGQVDKSGEPYVKHPLRMAAHFILVDDVEAAIVAALHDTVEDTWVTLGYLESYFPDDIIQAVDAITRLDGEVYRQYIKRVCQNDIARRVKKADVEDNLRPERRFAGMPLTRYFKTLGWIEGFELTGKFD